jgi:hypothetical protein
MEVRSVVTDAYVAKWGLLRLIRPVRVRSVDALDTYRGMLIAHRLTLTYKSGDGYRPERYEIEFLPWLGVYGEQVRTIYVPPSAVDDLRSSDPPVASTVLLKRRSYGEVRDVVVAELGQGKDTFYSEDPDNNAITVMGPPRIVQRVIRLVRDW